MEIYQPVALNEIGGRENNEDSIFPAISEANENDRLFLVCDGVGGSSKGEVASEMVCTLFPKYMKENPDMSETEKSVQKTLRLLEAELTMFKEQNPDSGTMSTTLTFLILEQNKAVIGWCGDSRVYHIRNGKILFQTKDHSLVNKLIEYGQITKKEALIDSRRNVILRAISGTENPTKIDISEISDIQKNDFFLLCTDGILEYTTEKHIKKWFIEHNEPEKIKDLIISNSNGTKDNFSMYLIKIKSV